MASKRSGLAGTEGLLPLSLGGPVISVDTKKMELVGPFKNGGASGGPGDSRSRS